MTNEASAVPEPATDHKKADGQEAAIERPPAELTVDELEPRIAPLRFAGAPPGVPVPYPNTG